MDFLVISSNICIVCNSVCHWNSIAIVFLIMKRLTNRLWCISNLWSKCFVIEYYFMRQNWTLQEGTCVCTGVFALRPVYTQKKITQYIWLNTYAIQPLFCNEAWPMFCVSGKHTYKYIEPTDIFENTSVTSQCGCVGLMVNFMKGWAWGVHRSITRPSGYCHLWYHKWTDLEMACKGSTTWHLVVK